MSREFDHPFVNCNLLINYIFLKYESMKKEKKNKKYP